MNNYTVFLIGANGYLGRIIHQALLELNYQVKVIGRVNSNYQIDGYFNEAGDLICFQEIRPDLIINLANSYILNPSASEIQRMHDSIVKLSENVTNYAVTNRVKLVITSSYFQYAPIDLQPWSEYAEMKRIAANHAKHSLTRAGVPFLELVLYDNYGGAPRGKILDLLVEAFWTGNRIAVNEGYSLINLIHIEDLVDAYLIAIRNFLSPVGGSSSFSLHGDETLTLRQLVQTIEKASGSKTKIQVGWGEKPYRNREMMHYWQPFTRLPQFEPRIKLVNYLNSLLKRD
jgi:nucleoside-diphosphate-sugar epimerase